jgi:hypothetical protein
MQILREVYQQQFDHFAKDETAARSLLAQQDLTLPQGMLLNEWAAWTGVSRTLLNLHEAVTRN